MLPAAAVALLLTAGGTEPLRAQGGADAGCDRECLRGFVTQYLRALIAHDASALPVAPDVKFTEDTVAIRLGEGLWKTASRLRTYRQDFLDVRAGTAGSLVVVEEGPSPVMLALRLKVAGRKITEVETMVVRNRSEGLLFEPDALQTATSAMTVVPERSQLHSREDAIRIAALYPAGLRAGSFVTVDVPFASDAYRFENGRLMAGPGCTFAPGCGNIKTQKIPTLPQTVHRLAAVDEELGIVWFRLDFGAGSVPTPNTKLIVWEAFKVYGGQIHAVEAFMEVVPMGAASGWD
jgi:hypothetical protein